MFSVIIPIHNKLPHLDRSIQSVLNQTYKEFEVILIDDVSSDGSSEKINDYSDSRIRIFRRDTPGPGGYAARNLGIKNAKFEWIAFLDADDEWDLNYLKEKSKAIQKYPEAELISSKWLRSSNGEISNVPEFNRIESLYNDLSLLDYFNCYLLVWTGAVAIKKELLIKSGLFPAGKCKRGGDMDTWIRCLYESKQSIFHNKKLSIYYKDTVNRVTDDARTFENQLYVPPVLGRITHESRDKELIIAANKHASKIVYTNIKRDLRNNKGIDKNKIKEIPVLKLKALIYTKLIVYKILILLELR